MTTESAPVAELPLSRPEEETNGDERMSFGDHLDELRSRVIRALMGVGVATVFCFFVGKDILALIYRPLLVVLHASGHPPQLQVLSPTAAFSAYLKIAFLGGLILAMPWVLHQGWAFVASGLFAHERRFVRLLVPASVGLFVVGVLFLYFIVLPVVLRFFVSFNASFPLYDLRPTVVERAVLPDTEPAPSGTEETAPLKVRIAADDPEKASPGDMWVSRDKRRLMVKTEKGVWSIPLEVGDRPRAMHSQFAIDFYISFVLMLALAFGVAFETPIVVFFLAWTGIVTTLAMKRARRYVVLVTVVAAAMLTPPDVISQMMLALPMYLLFELGVLLAGRVERRAAG